MINSHFGYVTSVFVILYLFCPPFLHTTDDLSQCTLIVLEFNTRGKNNGSCLLIFLNFDKKTHNSNPVLNKKSKPRQKTWLK